MEVTWGDQHPSTSQLSRSRDSRKHGRAPPPGHAEQHFSRAAGMPTSCSASSAGDAVQVAGTSHRLMQDIRAFGRIPKEVRGDSAAQVQERHLAKRLWKAKQEGILSAAQKSELAELKASELGGLAEAEAPPDPLDPFADDAASKVLHQKLSPSSHKSSKIISESMCRGPYPARY